MITIDTALIIVDMQNDFSQPHGALSVLGGFELINPIVKFMESFKTVVVTQDWHPTGHSSFDNPWPVHCVQGTWGSEISDQRILRRADLILRKGANKDVDSYSAFRENTDSAGKRRETGLKGFLFARGIRRTYYVGLARDYCVKWSALDADGLDPIVVWELTRAVNPNADQAVHDELTQNGVKIDHEMG